MAYIRQRGSQVLIVHGVRDPETRKVEQQILFTLYSRSEAIEILGRRGKESSRYFRGLLEDQYPEIRFNWKKIRAGIREHMDVLPDLYEYRTTRLHGHFRQDLVAFFKQLVLTDPQELASAASLIRDHREELGYVVDIIQGHLRLCDEAETSSFGKDNQFYWRLALRGNDVPPLAEEYAVGYYERNELDRAEAVFKMLVEAFDHYAEGHNYLGLIALDREDLEGALGHFEKTVEIGRKLFPKRIAKRRYWSELRTRPYMRGLRNQSYTLNRLGRYDEALEVCDRMEQECGDDLAVAAKRARVFLNTGRWRQAYKAAKYGHLLFPPEGFIAAMALSELGDHERFLSYLLHASLNQPEAARRLFGITGRKPKSREEIEGHNEAVSLRQSLHGYLRAGNRRSIRYCRKTLRRRDISELLEEAETVVKRWGEERLTCGDDRTLYDRMMEMHSWDFAEAQARNLLD